MRKLIAITLMLSLMLTYLLGNLKAIPYTNAQQQWWNNVYAYKRNILIQNNVSNPMVTGYPVRLHFDSGTVPTAAELYAASQSSTKGDDFRITYNNTTELSRWVQTFSSSQIDLWFKTQADIGGSSSNDTDYQLYYGNPGATNPPGDIDDVMPPGKDANTIGLWHFADGTGSTFVDTSGRGHHGNLPNTHGWGDDSFGPYIEWFGGGDNTAWGEVGSSSDFDLNALTLEAWVYPIGGGTPEQTIFYRPAALPENCPGYKFSATDQKIDLQLNCAAGRDWDGQLAFDTWYHIAGTFDGSTMRIYRNGSLIRTVSYGQSIRSTSGRPLFLGGSPFSQTFKGRVRHARLSNIQRTDFTYAANIAAISVAPSLTVGDVMLRNVAPTATDDSYSVNEDSPLTVAAPGVLDNDTDADGDPLKALLGTGPTHGILILNEDGSFTYTPNANYNGPDSFTYKANDGQADSNMATVSINVTPINDSPVAVDDPYSTDEDTPLNVTAPGVLSNDNDVDGDPLTATLVSDPSNGTLTLNDDGSFTYAPNPNFNGADSFTYKAKDTSNALSDEANVTITVRPINDAPTCANTTLTTDEDTAGETPPVCSDVDGDTLTYSIVGQGTKGVASVVGGQLHYQPNPNANGPDSFTYNANDDSLTSSPATVNVTITPVNDPPVANDDSATTDEDIPVTITVLGNDSDVDGDTMAVNNVTDPAHGTAVINPDGTITYTPDPEFSGTDSFTYEACDPSGLCDSATVTINVTPVNEAPMANAGGPYTGGEGGSVQLDGTGSSDPDPGDILTYEWDLDYDGVNFDVDTIGIQPVVSFPDNFPARTIALRVTDSGGLMDLATTSLEVINGAPNVDPPIIVPEPSDEGSPVVASATFSDPGINDTPFTCTVNYGDGSGDLPGTVSGNTCTGSDHTYADNGTYPVTVSVTDKDGGPGSSPPTPHVVNNVAPFNIELSLEPESLDENGTVTLSGSFDDPGFLDEHTVVIDWGDGSSDTLPLPVGVHTFSASHLYLDDNPTGTLVDVYTITVSVSDDDGGGGGSAMATVNNVNPVVGPISAPVDPIEVGLPVNASADFTDVGLLDTHTAIWGWGDGSQCNTTTDADCTVTEPSGSASGFASGSHAYTTPGVYTVTLTVTDDDGGSGEASFQEFVVVYDPSAGFVTGAGLIDSPAGAFIAEPTLTGKAQFGFVAKYEKGATTPSGQTQFRFKVADLDFHSASYQWLVVAGPKAQFKGDGTINGGGNYGFMLTAIDGELPGGGGSDKFRIKIWNKDIGDAETPGALVYDNQLGDADDAEPTTDIVAGNIVIHKGK